MSTSRRDSSSGVPGSKPLSLRELYLTGALAASLVLAAGPARAQAPPVSFEEVSVRLEGVHPERRSGGGGLHGVAFFDYDRDGRLDLFVGHHKPQANALFHNNGDGTWLQSEEVELSLYNLVGQKVATLVQGAREAGRYTVRWDGRDDLERPLATGIYLYRLRAGAQVETRKLLLLR